MILCSAQAQELRPFPYWMLVYLLANRASIGMQESYLTLDSGW